MAGFNFHKVTALPGTLDPNAIYFVLGNAADTFVEAYITDSAGVAKSMIGNPKIYQEVGDITARDALVPTLEQNTLVLVADASGDPTVNAGAAFYSFNQAAGTFSKLTEFESLDLDISAMTHANRAQIDKIGEDGNGDPTYDSVPLVRFATVGW